MKLSRSKPKENSEPGRLLRFENSKISHHKIETKRNEIEAKKKLFYESVYRILYSFITFFCFHKNKTNKLMKSKMKMTKAIHTC